MILLAGDLLGPAIRMLLIRRRRKREVIHRRQRYIALSIDLAGNRRQVAPGTDRQVASGSDTGTVLSDRPVVVMVAQGIAVHLLGRRDVHIARGLERGVLRALQHAAAIIDITPGADRQVVARLDP